MLKDSRPIRNSQRRERVREEVVKEITDGPEAESVDQSVGGTHKGSDKKV
jgi:hypothetical protein